MGEQQVWVTLRVAARILSEAEGKPISVNGVRDRALRQKRYRVRETFMPGGGKAYEILVSTLSPEARALVEREMAHGAEGIREETGRPEPGADRLVPVVPEP